MSLHESDLKARLTRFLGRKAMPRRLEGKPAAMEDEIASLSRVAAKAAPRGAEALASWWPLFEDALSLQCGAVWPTEKEILSAGRDASKDAPKVAGALPERDMRPQAIIARRMQAGEPVGEEWLWGASAVLLIAERLVDERTMSGYRSAAFLARSEAYGRDKALAWEAERKEAHRIAAELHKTRTDEKNPREIDLRATVAAE